MRAWCNFLLGVIFQSHKIYVRVCVFFISFTFKKKSYYCYIAGFSRRRYTEINIYEDLCDWNVFLHYLSCYTTRNYLRRGKKKNCRHTQGNSFHILPHDYLINLHLLVNMYTWYVCVMTTNVYQILNYHPFNFRGCRV